MLLAFSGVCSAPFALTKWSRARAPSCWALGGGVKSGLACNKKRESNDFEGSHQINSKGKFAFISRTVLGGILRPNSVTGWGEGFEDQSTSKMRGMTRLREVLLALWKFLAVSLVRQQCVPDPNSQITAVQGKAAHPPPQKKQINHCLHNSLRSNSFCPSLAQKKN